MAPPLTVNEVSAPYANFMFNPADPGPSVCQVCWTWKTEAYSTCYRCGFQPNWYDAVVPITYSVDGEQMHHLLWSYKNGADARVQSRTTRDLGAVLWRFLRQHEPCIAARAGVESFDAVTVVPSKRSDRDEHRGRLREMVSERCGVTKDRSRRLLRPSDEGHDERGYQPGRFEAVAPLNGANVLVIDDTWTTGGNAQSAAMALRDADAGGLAIVVLGRHVHRDWDVDGERNDVRLRRLPAFSWDTCAVHH